MSSMRKVARGRIPYDHSSSGGYPGGNAIGLA
jgi:hypothetical protein